MKLQCLVNFWKIIEICKNIELLRQGGVVYICIIIVIYIVKDLNKIVMKRILFVFVCLMVIFQFYGQEILFNNLDVIGVFGSVIVEIGLINGEVGVDVGGGGVFVMFFVFFGGYGMGIIYFVYIIIEGFNVGEYDVKFGYGGLWLGFVLKFDKFIYFYGSVKVGWGKV